jgi:hypothetical protein
MWRERAGSRTRCIHLALFRPPLWFCTFQPSTSTLHLTHSHLPCPAGVVENVLGRVVDAFESRMALVLGGSAAGRLAESLPVVQLMAKEPAAALLGSPVAFFVGRNSGGWVAGRAGLGGGECAGWGRWCWGTACSPDMHRIAPLLVFTS